MIDEVARRLPKTEKILAVGLRGEAESFPGASGTDGAGNPVPESVCRCS
jgi:hypothetical protein